jgi:hypothetical protein
MGLMTRVNLQKIADLRARRLGVGSPKAFTSLSLFQGRRQGTAKRAEFFIVVLIKESNTV